MRYATSCLLILFLLSGCGSDSNIVPDQRSAIENYVESRYPDYVVQNGVYKCVTNMDRSGYETATIASPGDSIWFHFAAYTFESSPSTSPYFTDIAEILEGDTVLNPKYWPHGPQAVKIGATPLIRGLTAGLPECRTGDSVLLFITSDLGYDDKTVGVVEKNTALMYFLKIENVKKQ